MREGTEREFNYFTTPQQLAEWAACAEDWTREEREVMARPTTAQRMASLGWSVVK